jgi:archaemetzincin
LHSFDVVFINLPLEIEPSFSAERGQYFSTSLIAETIKLTDDYDGKILVLAEFDLFVPVFTYVFGEAQLNGKHAIVSVCRLHEEFHSGETNDELLLERSLKEILHELGHTFGLIHCRDWECVMHVSQGIEEIDIKGKGFCHLCLNKILTQIS